jgi:transposase
MSRNTVARYRAAATRHGWLEGPLPDPAALAEALRPAATARGPQEQSLVEPFREPVQRWHEQGVEGQAIWPLLVEQHGFTGSYSSLKRFLHRLAPPEARATVRVEVAPGEEAQVDFGYAGQFLDPDRGLLRKAWAFVMTLSHSRHQYAELVFDQEVATWLRGHQHAFEFFGGVPRRVVPDYVARHIIVVLCPPPLCGQSSRPSCPGKAENVLGAT